MNSSFAGLLASLGERRSTCASSNGEFSSCAAKVNLSSSNAVLMAAVIVCGLAKGKGLLGGALLGETGDPRGETGPLFLGEIEGDAFAGPGKRWLSGSAGSAALGGAEERLALRGTAMLGAMEALIVLIPEFFLSLPLVIESPRFRLGSEEKSEEDEMEVKSSRALDSSSTKVRVNASKAVFAEAAMEEESASCPSDKIAPPMRQTVVPDIEVMECP